MSTAPVWVGQKLEPRPVVLRTYVTAAGDSYMVMPGGLARVAGARDLPIVSMQRGGGSKDTWVLSDGPVSAVSLLAPAGVPIRRERRATDLPSRVADDLYWLGRHVERAEHVVRLLRSVVARLTNEDTTEDTPELVALLQVLVALELLPSRLGEPMPLRDLEQELLAFLFKQHPQAGLRKTLNEHRRIAANVRGKSCKPPALRVKRLIFRCKTVAARSFGAPQSRLPSSIHSPGDNSLRPSMAPELAKYDVR